MGQEPFLFIPRNRSVEGEEDDLVAKIPIDINTKDELLQVLAKELKFPDYFGMNWDALSECLRDLDWLKSRRILIHHEGLPKLSTEALKTYLDILRQASYGWEKDDHHQLVISFSESVREKIKKLLQ